MFGKYVIQTWNIPINMCHEQLVFSDEFSVLLFLDSSYCNFRCFVNVETFRLTWIHFVVTLSVAKKSALADIGVDSSWNQECYAYVVVFQIH